MHSSLLCSVEFHYPPFYFSWIDGGEMYHLQRSLSNLAEEAMRDVEPPQPFIDYNILQRMISKGVARCQLSTLRISASARWYQANNPMRLQGKRFTSSTGIKTLTRYKLTKRKR